MHTATCALNSPLRNFPIRPERAAASPLSSFNEVFTSAREDCSAGANPNAIPVSTVSNNEYASTRTSGERCKETGGAPGGKCATAIRNSASNDNNEPNVP